MTATVRSCAATAALACDGTGPAARRRVPA
jgi:hypothetical protein